MAGETIETRRRKDRRGIVIILLALLLTVAIIVIIISFFINRGQSFNPFFKITYQARAVNAEVRASYLIEGSDTAVYFKSIDGEDYISFDASDENAIVKYLNMSEDISLKENVSSYVLFTYTFTNRNQSRKLSITMSDNANKQNVSVYYASSDDIAGDNIDEILNFLNSTRSTDNNLHVTCPKATATENTQVKVYVLVSLVDKVADALYETTESSTFTFTLESK